MRDEPVGSKRSGMSSRGDEMMFADQTGGSFCILWLTLCTLGVTSAI